MLPLYLAETGVELALSLLADVEIKARFLGNLAKPDPELGVLHSGQSSFKTWFYGAPITDECFF